MAEVATAAVSVDVSSSQPDHVTLNVVATPADPPKQTQAPAPVASTAAAPVPAPAPTQPAPAPTPTKPAEAKPSNPAPVANNTTTSSSSNVFQRTPDDFYSTIFYFSGMGSVIGSALAEGIYVNEKNRRNAVDAEIIENSMAAKGKGGSDELVVTARGQAQGLSTDFHRLHGLLDALPIYTGTTPVPVRERQQDVDQPIHGELYFRCKERFPVQPGGGSRPHSRASQEVAGSIGSGVVEERTVRRRQQNDDVVLADVARAAVESFPLLPPPQRTPSRGQSPSISMSPSPGPYAASTGSETPSRRRRQPQEDVNRGGYVDDGGYGGRPPVPGQMRSSAGSTTYVDGSGGTGVKSWQMSHVRQYEVGGGYPIGNDRP